MLAVTQVIIGSDREMCRLLQLLSPELCLVLLGAARSGQAMITLVCMQLLLSAQRSPAELTAADRSHTVKKGREPFKRLSE